LRFDTQPYPYKPCHFTAKGTQVIFVFIKHAYRLSVTVMEEINGIALHKNTKTAVEQTGIGRKEEKLQLLRCSV